VEMVKIFKKLFVRMEKDSYICIVND